MKKYVSLIGVAYVSMFTILIAFSFLQVANFESHDFESDSSATVIKSYGLVTYPDVPQPSSSFSWSPSIRTILDYSSKVASVISAVIAVLTYLELQKRKRENQVSMWPCKSYPSN